LGFKGLNRVKAESVIFQFRAHVKDKIKLRQTGRDLPLFLPPVTCCFTSS